MMPASSTLYEQEDLPYPLFCNPMFDASQVDNVNDLS